MKRRWIWVALAVVVVITGAAILAAKLTSRTAVEIGDLPCQGTAGLLTHSPMNIADIDSIIPLGNFTPPGHVIPTTHMYWRYPLKDGVPQEATIYSPANMTMTKITKFDNGGSTTPFDSYRLDFQVCPEVTGYFFHVVKLSEKLQAAFHEPFDGTQSSDVGAATLDNSWQKIVSVDLAAGEVIGTAGGNKIYPDSLDLAIEDSRAAPGVVANPDRWPASTRQTVCPLDYFSSETSATLYGLLGGYQGPDPTIDEPRCGEVYQDKPGTAQGIWVSKDMPPGELLDVNKQLTLGHSNYNHQKAVFSFGNEFKELGITPSSLYSFDTRKTGQVNRDFSEITPDNQVYCFDISAIAGQSASDASVLVQLRDSTTLLISKLEKFGCGTGPWPVTNYLEYIR